jgi:hypothetical protein
MSRDDTYRTASGYGRLNMTDYLEAVSEAPGLPREDGLDNTGELKYLLQVCNDASDSATTIAELLTLDNDPDTAEVFRDISTERTDFARRLSLMLTKRGHQDAIDAKGTFRGRLFRWRLQIARHLPVGYHDVDDRRFLLHLARQGSDLVTNAYADAESRPLGPHARQEVHRQAEAIRATNRHIHRLAANA